MDSFIPTYIATATTTVIGKGAQMLGSIILGETAAGTITVYNGTSIIAVLKASIAEQTFEFNVACPKGLSIVTGAASKLTVTSKPMSA